MNKLKKSLLVILMMTLSVGFQTANAIEEGSIITDQEAIELGLTQLDKKGNPIKNEKSGLTLWQRFLEKIDLSKEDDAWKSGPDEHKAEVVILVNKSKEGTSHWAQKARVYYKGELVKTFTVSTGKEVRVTSTSGKSYIATTPVGYYRPQTIWKEYQSSTWVGATMNFPIFFTGGIALHSTTPDHYAELGKRASGGCVRFMPEDAQYINELVLQTGLDSWAIKDRSTTINGRKIKRMQVTGGEIPVLGVYRDTGIIYNTTKVNSWDTLIVVKEYN